MILKAKDYQTRSDLENAVRNKFGLTTEPKDATIEGTTQELAKLNLSSRVVFWGISVKETNPDVELTTKNIDKTIRAFKRAKSSDGFIQPNLRGEQTDFGINGKQKDSLKKAKKKK